MLTATLYQPQHSPQAVPADGLVLPNPITGFASVTQQAATLLECTLEMVDVQACGPTYVVYTIFDCEAPINEAAMTEIAAIIGEKYDFTDEHSALYGPVLIVRGPG